MEPEVVLERGPEAVADEAAAPPPATRRSRRRGRRAAADRNMAPEADFPQEDRPADPPQEAEGPPGEGDPAADSAADPAADPAAKGRRKRRKASTADAGEGAQAPAKLGPGEELSDGELERRLSALLFSSPEPLGLGRLVALLEGPAPARVRSALESLPERLEAAGLPVELREIAGGFQLLTAPDVFETVARLARVRREEKVSPAALETLAVVAYRQPVTKAEVEAIRGVQVGPILRALVDRRLVRVVGRAEVPGQPLLYGTTRRFLESFGLAGLKELPRDSELVRD